MECGVACIVFGLLLFFPLWQRRWRAYASRQWPTATGTILSGRVVETVSERDPSLRGWIRGAMRRDILGYHAVLEFTYPAAGASIQRSFEIDNSASDQKAAAEADLGRYPAGATLPVRYNPNKPQEYFIADPRANLGRNYGTWRVLGVMIILFGLVMVFITSGLVLLFVGGN